MSKYRKYLRNLVLASATIVLLGGASKVQAEDNSVEVRMRKSVEFTFDFRDEEIMKEMEEIVKQEALEQEKVENESNNKEDEKNEDVTIGNRDWEHMDIDFIRLETEFGTKVYVSMKNTSHVTVYSAMDASSKYTGKLFPGSCAEIIGEEKGWYLVKAKDFQGYVPVDQVLTGTEAAETIQEELKEVAVVITDVLNIRNKPSTEGESIASVAAGAALTLLKEGSVWCQVQVGEEQVGYVSAEYVSVQYKYTDTISEAEETRIAEEKRKAEEAAEAARREEEARRREEERRQEEARREQARLDAIAAQAGLPAGSIKSLGVFRVTHYCTCTICTPGLGITATGTIPAEGRTVAISKGQIAFGSTVVLNGHAYIAEDCGVGPNCIDIYVSNHARALQLGMYYTEVFVRVR